MEYTMSRQEKWRQRSLLFQVGRFMVLSLKFMRLLRQGACGHLTPGV
jgi:hypothetical protein